MDADESQLPAATVVRPPNGISGVISAAVFVIIIGTVVGLLLAYVAAFVVVKLGLPTPTLVVGLPLIAVAALAWATTGNQVLRDGVLTALAAGAIAAALIAVWAPRSPASLFTTRSNVTDVQVRGDHANITLESKREMTEMPSFGATTGYATLLACFAVIAATLGHGAMSLRKRHATPF